MSREEEWLHQFWDLNSIEYYKAIEIIDIKPVLKLYWNMCWVFF
jgi:hypothetical protein